jgi:NADPH-dependent 2,4-dienoyl-CoA reductase/sulfur reductase-like enzyme
MKPTDEPGILIIGGGLASQRCGETLRLRGYDGRIRIVCGEPEFPYDRPPLSKGLLAGDLRDQDVAFRDRDWYDDQYVELIFDRCATRLEAKKHTVELGDGTTLRYEKLLIATGSAARRLPALQGYSNVHYLRTIENARRLRDEVSRGARLVIIGAGFIGQEVAATARQAGAEVTIVEALPAPLAGVLGEDVGRRLMRVHDEEGVEVRLSTMLEGARGNGAVEELILTGGERLECHAVVVGVGVSPAAEWLEGSGLGTDGVITDQAGRTALPDVFAAGDVATSFDPRLGEHRRTEHWDAAARQGAAAAKAMLGEEPDHPPVPSFWSDQYGLRIQYAGHADLADDVRLEGAPGARAFTVVYSRDGEPVGALTVDNPRAFARLRKEIERSHAEQTGKE